MVNLSSFIYFHALRQADKPALVYAGAPVSYGELDRRIVRAAAFLASKVIGADDIVAVFMKNSAAFVEIAFATSHLGAVFLPVNFRLSGEECSYIVAHAGAKLLLADEEFATTVAGIDNVVLLDVAAQSDSSRLAAPGLPAPGSHPRKPEDLFRLMYTSGTTDRPKGVMHSYENFYWKCMDHVIALGMSEADRLLAVGPLYHVGAFDLPGIAILWVGGTLVVQRQFDETETLALIEAERVTCAWFAPMMVGRMLALEGAERYDLSSFKWCIAGGEKTPENRIRDFTRLFRAARFIDGYGLTETCSGDTLMEAGKEIEKIGSTGRALAHVEITIRDDEGELLPTRTEGEICLRGPKVTKGYWRDPKKTEQSFYSDWFRSGDVGYLDEDGFLFITDRKKDMIISGGENIASSEIERVIYQMSEVADCAVIGLPDPKWGERPAAIIVARAGQVLSVEEVQSRCRAALAGFKVPSRIFFRDALPRNPSGKVLKRVLRDELAGGIESEAKS
ncbi:AMP-binding protein [Mesorhizobium sp. KR9-304]|uniref:AMP-binding protein n=1 Tax=Mesorhizobium sp. KR9-304 TaxID=3156614 RepID=UPI0032B5C709